MTFYRFYILLIGILPQILISQTIFDRVVTSELISTPDNYRSPSWVDYDRDGDPDLFITNYNQPSYLYANDGNGDFSRIVGNALTDFAISAQTGTWADYNHDGFLDVFLPNTDGPNAFFANLGNGQFEQKTDIGLVSHWQNSRDATWGDLDGDGWMDLVVTNAIEDSKISFYRNVLGDHFELMPINFGMGFPTNITLVDYDQNGFPDLYVANAGNPNYLFRNDGGWQFTQITSGPHVMDSDLSRGAIWGDYDNDGDFDLYVVNGSNSTPERNRLYRNDGNEVFTRVDNSGLTALRKYSTDASWADFDRDGDLDIMIVNSDWENDLYQNNGNGTFSRMDTELPSFDIGSSKSVTWIDYDRDDDLDLFVTNGSSGLENNFLYQNTGVSGNWLNLKIEGGPLGDFGADGVVARVKAVIQGDTVWQMKRISAKAGRGHQEFPELFFGLGDAALVDSLHVFWPWLPETPTLLTNITVNQRLVVNEPGIPTLFEIQPDSQYTGLSQTITIDAFNVDFLAVPIDSVAIENSQGRLITTIVTGVTPTRARTTLVLPTLFPTGIYDFIVFWNNEEIILPESFRVLEPAPITTVSGDSFGVAVRDGDSLEVELTLFNNAEIGGGDLEFRAFITTDPVLLSANKRTGSNASYTPTQSPNGVDHRKVFADAGRNYGYYFWDDLTQFVPMGGLQDMVAGDLGPDGRFYMAHYDIQSRFRIAAIDTLTGADTLQAFFGLGNFYYIEDLDYSQELDKWFISSSYEDLSRPGQVHEIDVLTGVTNLIASMPELPQPRAIVATPEGKILVMDGGTNSLNSLDPVSGEVTRLGPSSRYYSMEFDPETGNLYGAQSLRIKIVNPNTGASFLSRDGLAEGPTSFGLSGDPSQRIFTILNYHSGLVPPQSDITIEILVKATSRLDSLARGWLIVNTNDPENPLFEIPLTVTEDNAVGNPENLPGIPAQFALEPAYPNPFNPETHIHFSMANSGDVRLEIFNALGQKVRTLVEGRMPAGRHAVLWNGRNDAGGALASGIYFLHLKVLGFYQGNLKLVLLR
ncbi:MAG TPA: FG-GAP-like repeat-containing protein [Calditrichia bacterium]|nr:VCBS repeat-containing protein [Calditrichota bacterium]HQU71188.1 FG-GAP-like repeat-containing protein [Calditrichia bacterium]HQV30346.1 FG-GAP-like repeat-containing protein [Calditrichia bacterium]